ncbi:hypothetical protein ABK040_010326 [Willaertia magna]
MSKRNKGTVQSDCSLCGKQITKRYWIREENVAFMRQVSSNAEVGNQCCKTCYSRARKLQVQEEKRKEEEEDNEEEFVLEESSSYEGTSEVIKRENEEEQEETSSNNTKKRKSNTTTGVEETINEITSSLPKKRIEDIQLETKEENDKLIINIKIILNKPTKQQQ